MESLLTLLHNQGVKIQKAKEEITPKEIQQIIESIEGLPNEAMISRLVLRSMKQAKYTTECSGHLDCSKILLPFYISDQKIP